MQTGQLNTVYWDDEVEAKESCKKLVRVSMQKRRIKIINETMLDILDAPHRWWSVRSEANGDGGVN